jgi:hypothetical protein
MSQSGLFTRLKQAKSCYPYKTEFWLQYVIISLDGTYTKGERSTTIQIENALHEESKTLSTVTMQKDLDPEQGKRPREYRVLSNDTQLRTLLKKTLNANRKKWDYIVSFTKTGWSIIANDRVIDTPISSIARLKPKKNASTPNIHSLPLNKSNLILPKGLKDGDTVPASDNWAKFKVFKIINSKHIVATFRGKKQYDIRL